MPDRLDQEADVAVVDAGDGVAEADVRPVGEAGGEARSCFAGRAGEPAGVQGGDGGFPVDRRRAVPWWMKQAKSSRSSQVPWAMISPVAASSA